MEQQQREPWLARALAGGAHHGTPRMSCDGATPRSKYRLIPRSVPGSGALAAAMHASNICERVS